MQNNNNIQLPSNFPTAEPLADARGTLGFRGTPVENHCCRLIAKVAKTAAVVRHVSFAQIICFTLL